MDVKELFEFQLAQLNQLVDEVFCIPDDVFRAHGGSAFYALLAQDKYFEGDPATDAADESFEALCRSAPHVPTGSMQALSLAYGVLSFLASPRPDGSPLHDDPPQAVVQVLLLVAWLSGKALGGVSQNLIAGEAAERMRSAFLSMAGSRGGRVRSQKFEPIKKWAIEKAAAMKADDKKIARTLAAQLPVHLAEVSDDPERLIYDTLRATRKLN